jgi:hypothetical protein
MNADLYDLVLDSKVARPADAPPLSWLKPRSAVSAEDPRQGKAELGAREFTTSRKATVSKDPPPQAQHVLPISVSAARFPRQ